MTDENENRAENGDEYENENENGGWMMSAGRDK